MAKEEKKSRASGGQGFRFEKAMKDLERVVARLEKGNLPLEESLQAFEEGVKLVRACRQYLDQTRQRIEILLGEQGGEPFYREFESEESGGDEESEPEGSILRSSRTATAKDESGGED
jgi:exodeoxyribonuclease VII small subunit